jgi:hypothetical protein
MKRTSLAALLAIALATPAAAQKDDIINMSVTVARPVRTVYTEALHAGLRDGWTFNILLLDNALYTIPGKAGDGKSQAVMRYTFEPKGDSTTMTVSAVAVDASGENRCTTQDCHMAEMMTAMAAITAVTKRLDSLGVARRTAADSLAEAGAFGYSTRNAIRVGGGRENGERNQFAYLDALRGPGGETVTYFRIGSCCQFETPNGLEGKTGLLDAYEVTYPGLPRPVTLYMNLYDPPEGTNPVPQGFTRAPGPGNPRS